MSEALPTLALCGSLARPWSSAPSVRCHWPAGRTCGPWCARRRRCCFPCDLHLQCAQGSLADVVVPVAFAVKGGSHARHLWQYKSARPPVGTRDAAATMLRALLLVFLRDHGACLWRTARIAGPTHLAVD